MEDMTNWVAFLVLGGGLYVLFAAYQMKVQGIINSSLLLTKETAYKKCKDKEAYIKEMFPTLLLFGVVTTACGAIDLLNTYVVDIAIVYFASLAVFVIVFILFIRKSSSLRKKYY